MSYCRAGQDDSDIYIIATIDSRNKSKCWVCYGGNNCYHLTNSEYFYNLLDLLSHLIDHLRNGDKVPIRTTDRVLRELRNEESI